MIDIVQPESSLPDAPKYQYQPLPQHYIRLINLLPGRTGDLLRCTITSSRLFFGKPVPAYEAISYCWGDANDTLPVECDGARLHITRNLHMALSRLRDEVELRTLWADAICIDQSNDEEKAQQVSMMLDIYTSAGMVYSWLGEAGGESDHAMDFLSSFDFEVKTDWKHDDGCSAFFDLLKRPYFQRIWVVQENAAARSSLLMCGGKSVPLEKFFHALQNLNRFIEISGPGWRPFEQFSEVKELSNLYLCGKPINQLYTFQRFRKSHATDGRDKLFALFGLLRVNFSTPGYRDVSPDYRSSVRDIYKEFAIATLINSHTLDILSVPKVQGLDNLPSWVPDWTVDSADPSWLHYVEETFSFTNYHRRGKLWRATSYTQAEPKFDRSGQLLGLSGYILDSISCLGAILNLDMLGTGMELQVLDSWEQMADIFAWKRYVNNEPVIDAYWKTLIVGNFDEGEEHILKRGFIQWRANSLKKKFRYPRSFAESILSAADREFFVQRVAAGYRRLVKTEKGYLALVPGAACVGDEVGLFEGGKAPLIVRPKGEQWQLVGDSYVHGVMDGEAFEPDHCKTMWFS